jgi:type VI secretion system protein ImpI
LSDALTAPEGRGLSGLVEPHSTKSDGLVIDGEFAEAIPVHPSVKPVVDDPLAALDKATAGGPGHGLSIKRAEPLESFGATAAPINPMPSEAVGTQQSDSRIEVNSAVSFQKAPSFIFDGEEDDFDEELIDQVALKPLARALGLPLSDMNSLESELALSEVGGALRAAIEGLRKLFASRAGRASRFPLSAMHLHVVEDNPLRFCESGQEAMETLFARHGTLHLSASAAIAESLENLGHHQDATETAADRALGAVFTALKPAALERRFAAYARNSEPVRGPEHDAWCWQMYKAYLEELSSHRQEGLQMLFWEVFAYEYQAAMRAFVHGAERDPAKESGQ